MKFNWKPERVAFLDFETRSDSDLSTVSKYTNHYSTVVLTCVVKTGIGEVRRYGPFLKPQDLEELAHIAERHTLVAHNAPFDAAVWERVAGLPEATWFDTLPCARAAGLPGKLDDLSKVVTGRGKDPMGKKLVSMLCLPNKVYPPVDSPAYGLLMQYNLRDVEELEAVYGRVKDFTEPDVMTVDRVINDRGIPVDREFLRRLQELYEWNESESRGKFDETTRDPITGFSINPGSPKQVMAWLHGLGFAVPNINKTTWRDLNTEPEKFFAGDKDEDFNSAVEIMQEALRFRREVVRVGKSKVETAKSILEADDRIREQMVYWGAHTGRWSGRALQVHNMPAALRMAWTREAELTKDFVLGEVTRIEAAENFQVHVSDILNTSLRHMVRSPIGLLVADYGAVELRGVAWMADEFRMLETLANPASSIYTDMGFHLFGQKVSKKNDPERYAFCKSLVLGCGYGMSGGKFDYMMRFRSTMTTESLNRMGVDPKAAVGVFRNTYPRIPQLWKAVGAAAFAAVDGTPIECGKCRFSRSGPDLYISLPSGRRLVYRNARVEPRVPKYALTQGQNFTIPTVVYDNPRGYTGQLFGSLLVENIVQAMCRDFLAQALIDLERINLNPILHVHDEIVCETGPDKLDTMLEVMSTPPTWAPDFPLLVEGYAGPVWSKQTRGYTEKVYMRGREVFK